jgi:hypothetical protein
MSDQGSNVESSPLLLNTPVCLYPYTELPNL